MLKEAAPAMTRVAVMQNPDHPAWTAYLRVINEVARTFCARAPTAASSYCGAISQPTIAA